MVEDYPDCPFVVRVDFLADHPWPEARQSLSSSHPVEPASRGLLAQRGRHPESASVPCYCSDLASRSGWNRICPEHYPYLRPRLTAVASGSPVRAVSFRLLLAAVVAVRSVPYFRLFLWRLFFDREPLLVELLVSAESVLSGQFVRPRLVCHEPEGDLSCPAEWEAVVE